MPGGGGAGGSSWKRDRLRLDVHSPTHLSLKTLAGFEHLHLGVRYRSVHFLEPPGEPFSHSLGPRAKVGGRPRTEAEVR